MGLLAAVAALLTLVAERSIKLRHLSALLIVSLGFVVWTAASIFWSIDRNVSLGFAFTFMQLWIMIWILWQFSETPEQSSRLRQAYMYGTVVAIAAVIIAFLSDEPTVGDAGRFTALGTNANYAAQSIALAIPMGLYAMVSNRGWRRVLPGMLLVGCVIGIGLTGSRSGALVATIVFVAGLFLIVRTSLVARLLLLVGAVALIAGLGLIIPAETRSRFLGTVNAVEAGSFTGREDIWRAGLHVWQNRPGLGIGSGAYATGVEAILGEPKAAHNSFLNILVDLGPVGVMGFALMFAVAIWPHLVRLFEPIYFRHRTPQKYILSMLQLVLLLGLFLSQQAANWQYSRATWFILAAATLDHAIVVRPERSVTYR